MRSLALTLSILLIVPIGAALGQPDITSVVSALDRLYRSDDSYAEMTMTIVTPDWERTLTMKAWSEGTDKTFIRILSPARDAGMATLRIGDEMWNYLPNTNSTVRIPPSMMSGAWMGSDITNNDIVREVTYLDDYSYSYVPDSSLGADTVLIRLVPKASATVVWSSIECAVDLTDMIPLWEKYYDSSGDLIRTITYSDVQSMDGRTIPTTMTVEPAEEDGNRTTISWSNVQFDRGVDQGIFTLRNLQSSGND